MYFSESKKKLGTVLDSLQSFTLLGIIKMTIIEIIKCIIPSFILIGIGILEINYPYVMNNFDDAYTGRGISGFILLLIELFIKLTWGKLEGFIAIILGVFLIVIFLLPDFEAIRIENSNVGWVEQSETQQFSTLFINFFNSFLVN